MDPTANLTEQLQIATRLDRNSMGEDPNYGDVDARIDAERLAELVLELSIWLKNGGAYPTQWVKGK